MTQLDKNDQATLEILRQNDGSLVIDKRDPTQRELWKRLERLVEAGCVEKASSDVRAVAYRLHAG